MFRIDVLKKYYARDKYQAKEISTPTSTDVRYANVMSLIDNVDDEANDGFREGLPCPFLKRTETWVFISMMA